MRNALVILVLILVSNALAQAPDSLWSRAYGGSSIDECQKVLQTHDGGYLLAGTSYSFGPGSADYWVIKTDMNGDSLWSRTYGGAGAEECYGLLENDDHSFTVAGRTGSFGPRGPDYWILSADENGDSLWSRAFGGEDSDVCRALVFTQDHGYLLAGYSYSFGAGSADYWIVKTDYNGDSLWSRTYGGSGGDYCLDAHMTSDGGFILAGYTVSFGAGDKDMWIVKTNADGDSLWSKTFGGPEDDKCYSVWQTSDGGFILAGTTNSFDIESGDIWLVRTDANGDSLWSHTYGGNRTDEGFAVQQTRDGRYVIAGRTRSYGVFFNGDFWLIKTEANGDSLWSRTFGGGNAEEAYAFQVTSDDGYVLAGYTKTFSAGYEDFWIVKTGFDITLPVEMLSFSAIPTEEGIAIQFTTGTEQDNSHFEIMRSTTQDGDFEGIARLESQGESVMEQSYSYIDRDVIAGETYWYYLADVDLSGARTEHPERMVSATAVFGSLLPEDYKIAAYPNPFNATTTLTFDLVESGVVSLKIYDLNGREAATVANESCEAGHHEVKFDASELPSGIYVVRMEAGAEQRAVKIVLLK